MAALLFYIAVVCCMMSQIPSVLEQGLDGYLKLSWLLPFAWLLPNYSKFFNKELLFFYVFLIAFFAYCFLCENVTGTPYLGTDLYNMANSCFIYSISYVFWYKYGSPQKLKLISIIVLICAFLLAIIVYDYSLRGVSLEERQYAFQAKNSMGQILLASCIIAITTYIPKIKPIKILYAISMIVIIVVMFIMKSRATILGFFFVVAFFSLKYNNRRIRMLSFVLVVLLVGYILVNENAYDSVVNNILLGNRNTRDLDDLSSGRLSLMIFYIQMIPDNLFFGIGNKYLDCFPVVMVLQYGLIGALLVFFFLYRCAVYVNRQPKDFHTVGLALFLMFWVFMVNSLFEAQPPFGPGVKCFLLWMLLGFSLAENHKSDYLKQA